MQSVFNKIPAMAYLNGLCAQLKARNCKVALVSSGIPATLVKKLASSINADYAYGVEVGESNGSLTGKIWGDAISRNGKLKIICDILNKHTSQPKLRGVADTDNRASSSRALKIGFNPIS
jgi:phosphoserine phosphatase